MKSKINTALNLLRHFARPFGRIRFVSVLVGYLSFFRDLTTYKRQSREKIRIADLTPMLLDRTPTQPFDNHYIYQGVWAFEKIMSSRTTKHVDVGGQIDLVAFLTTVTDVEYIDIRALWIDLPRYKFRSGTVLELPFESDTLGSLSCLHVAEHIGLGRYGDPLDPLGTEKACKELARVLKKGGNLYFSLPVGREKVCFNAHRIHSVKTILSYFAELTLVDLAGINTDGSFVRSANLTQFDDAHYSTGLFHFRKDV